MSFKFQLPPITAETSVAQLKSYLMQMSEQLEYALNNLETDNFTVDAKQKITSTAAEETGHENYFYGADFPEICGYECKDKEADAYVELEVGGVERTQVFFI